MLATPDGPVKALAGGTDLIVQMRQGGLEPHALVSLRDVPGLDVLGQDGHGNLVIGSVASLGAVENSQDVRAAFPGIAEADFKRIAEAAKDGCPISKMMTGNVKLSVEATLEA